MMKKFKSSGKDLKILLVVAILAIVLPLILNLNISTLSILIIALLYMYWSSAWNILGGYAGLFSLGNGIYIGLGAYITGCLYVYGGVSPFFGMIIAGVLVGLFSMAMGYPTFRLMSIYYSLATFALVNVFKIIFTNFKSIGGIETGGSDGFKFAATNDPLNMQFVGKLPYYYIALALLLIIILVSYIISRSKWGYQFRAISANLGAAASLGIDVMQAKMRAQFISAFFTAIGGGFYCMFMRYIDPSSVFSSSMSCNIMIMCVVGGANTLWGPAIGAGILYTVQRIITIYAPSTMSGLADVIFGGVLMVCVLVIPGGLLASVKERRSKQAGKKTENSVSEG